MVKGKRITACYMFCDVRNFTDTTECLEEDVMVYVNKLGELVHLGIMYYGTANKNVGDAFLLSWKMCDGNLPSFSSFTDEPNEEYRLRAKKFFSAPHSGAGDVRREFLSATVLNSVLAATVKVATDLQIANDFGNLRMYRERPE